MSNRKLSALASERGPSGTFEAIHCLGQTLFAKFEIETPQWRKILKWTILHGGTIGLYFLVGHWALLFPLAGMAVGCIVHATWCRTHDIDPWRATPRERYYELRGWPARE